MSAAARDGPQAQRRPTVNDLAARARRPKRYEPVGGEGVHVRATLRDLGVARAEVEATERLMVEADAAIKRDIVEKGAMQDETFRRWNVIRQQLAAAESRVRTVEALLKKRAGDTGGYP